MSAFEAASFFASRRHQAEEQQFMKTATRNRAVAVLSLCLAALAPMVAHAQDEDPSTSPVRNGPYVSLLGTGVYQNDDSLLDDGFGGTLALGFRNGWYAFEVAPSYVDMDTATLLGGAVNALVFPLAALPNLYGTAGLSATNYEDYETAIDEFDFNTVNWDLGLGYLFGMSWGRYDFGIRAEARYRIGRREEDFNDQQIDFDAPRRLEQTIVNIGLHLPIGLRPEPPPPPAPEPPVEVVAPPPACSDGADNDGDGLIDFPADPGCTSADDDDETDPPQCADGKDNDGDGLIDFPADPGCTAADDNDEVDPCKTPELGERISLRGCGTGDILILRGVNFDFDRARLTVNAKTILDNVAEELVAYPEVEVELSGHTDGRGSESYNLTLSDRRAASVKAYLADKGIASERMTTVGEGEVRPVADNETDEGRELNRRVELKITAGVATASGVEASVADPVEGTAAEDAVFEASAVEGEASPVFEDTTP